MKPRLSGYEYVRQWGGVTTVWGSWKTDAGDDRYEYCSKACQHEVEHEYAFDGQVFYKKKELKK